MFYPLTFQPILKERVWGGRQLERLYRKPLPPVIVPIGESWEISDDRPEGVSVIAEWTSGRARLALVNGGPSEAELLGKSKPSDGRFPLARKDRSMPTTDCLFRIASAAGRGRSRWVASPKRNSGLSLTPGREQSYMSA